MRRAATVIPQLLLAVALAGAASSPLLLPSAATAQRNENSPRSVYGHVLNRENQPCAKAVVYLKDTKTLVIRSYITAPDGAFKFSALAANVDYEIYADFEGGHSPVKTLGAFDERKHVDVTLKIRPVR
jgi:Carboxypeptidase regulatory-like domain